MKKLKFIALFLILPLAISCSQIKTAVNTVMDKPGKAAKLPAADIPKNIQSSTPEGHFSDEKAIIVSVIPSERYYVGENQYPLEVLNEVIEKRLRENPSERQLIYLNGDVHTDYGEVIAALDSIRKANIENIGLRVAPKNENDREIYILKVKIPAEPKETDVISKPNPLTLVLSKTKDGKTKLNNQELEPEKVTLNLAQIFKAREENGVFRGGTNDIEKTISIKVPRSFTYRDAVLLVDAAIGAGASPVYLQIDDLEM